MIEYYFIAFALGAAIIGTIAYFKGYDDGIRDTFDYIEIEVEKRIVKKSKTA